MTSPAASAPDVGVIMAAAGAGMRARSGTAGHDGSGGAGAGEPKQFQLIAGVPMLLRALQPFTAHPDVCHVVVVLAAEYVERPPDWLARLVGRRLTLVRGGAERVDSVRAGLRALAEDAAVVLVHDAARPFVARRTIDQVLGRARAGVGAIAAVPASDTMKTVTDDRRIVRTVPRAGLWRAQTPQGFPREMLASAYERFTASPASPAPTDEAELCERAGYTVEVVPDASHNFKITTADDVRLAEALAREPL